MRGVGLAQRARHRWRRATGADSLAHAAQRAAMAEVAVGEEVRLMAQVDIDLTELETVVLAVAARRTGKGA